MTPRSWQKKRTGSPVGRLVRRLFAALLLALAVYYGLCTLLLLLYTAISPPTTGVQLQRRVASFFEEEPYEKQYASVARDQMAPHLAHAVVAAEDGRFYAHGGVDWQAVRKALCNFSR